MDFAEIWARIQAETDLEKPGQMAEIVGTTRQYISRKKSENRFPIEWGFHIAQRYGLLTEWVLLGKGPRRITEYKDCKKDNIFSEIETWVAELVVKHPGRKDWFEITFMDCFPMFEEWRKRREQEKDKDSEFPRSHIA